MTIRMLKREMTRLSRPELERIKSLATIPGERAKERPRLKWLAGLLEDGKFNKLDWASCRCKEDGRQYRSNGQHTSYLLDYVVSGETVPELNRQLDVKFPEGIPLVWEHWECESRAELAEVFDQFDSHRSARKPKDKLGVYVAQHQDLTTVSQKLIQPILTGVNWGYKRREDIAQAVTEDYHRDASYERGELLNVPAVREFILFVADRQPLLFKEWQGRPGQVACFFELFLKRPTDSFRVLFEAVCFEACKSGREIAQETRRNARAKGGDAGSMFRAMEKSMVKVEKELKGMTSEEVEQMLDKAKELAAEDE